LTIVIDKNTHFINNLIYYLIDQFILRHTKFIVYYPQGNGQAKSINKIFGILFKKLVNENQNDWDEHPSIVLFSYRIVFKVGTNHTPIQLVYRLHPLVLREYLLPSKPSQNYDPKPIKVLISHLSKLEKFQENQLVSSQDLVASNQ
jgi:hypothetical protein